ncbi:hypothetical protein DHODJN_13990 [Methylorubrum extorquens]
MRTTVEISNDSAGAIRDAEQDLAALLAQP